MSASIYACTAALPSSAHRLNVLVWAVQLTLSQDGQYAFFSTMYYDSQGVTSEFFLVVVDIHSAKATVRLHLRVNLCVAVCVHVPGHRCHRAEVDVASLVHRGLGRELPQWRDGTARVIGMRCILRWDAIVLTSTLPTRQRDKVGRTDS